MHQLQQSDSSIALNSAARKVARVVALVFQTLQPPMCGSRAFLDVSIVVLSQSLLLFDR
jgi:hypothetical protein